MSASSTAWSRGMCRRTGASRRTARSSNASRSSPPTNLAVPVRLGVQPGSSTTSPLPPGRTRDPVHRLGPGPALGVQSTVPETDTPSWLSRALSVSEKLVSKPPLAPELPPRPRPRVCLPGPGALTQLVECHLCKVEVRGSSPLCSTKTIGSEEAHWPAEETKVEDWDRPLATDPSPNIRLGMTATT